MTCPNLTSTQTTTSLWATLLNRVSIEIQVKLGISGVGSVFPSFSGKYQTAKNLTIISTNSWFINWSK